MSTDVPKPVEETPAPATAEATPAVEKPELAKAATAVPATEDTDASQHPAEATDTVVGGEPTPVPTKHATEETISKGEAIVEATHASEGVLGYKAPGLKQLLPLRFSKHYFWFSDEPLTAESLTNYVHNEKKSDVAHHHASWAQETGKGFLFFAKRDEDKATPAGMISLADFTELIKEGPTEFAVKASGHTYKFQAATTEERASWIVAIEKKAEEAKGMKEAVVGSEGYKKNLKSYALTAAPIVAAKAADSSTPTTTSETTATNGVAKEAETPAEDAAKDDKTKSRSHSRKRGSIFGVLRVKKDEHDEQKELKKEDKVEEEAEKEGAKLQKAEEKATKKAKEHQLKEQKKAEAEAKKEQAKQEHDATKAKEAAGAAAIAAVPAVAVAAEEKKAEKSEEPTESATTTEKRAKRGSVFGMFGKKPATEKADKETAPTVPAKDTELPIVAETTPAVDGPAEAVGAPVAAPVAVEEPSKEPTTTAAAEPASTPKTEEKSGFFGLIKKAENKFAHRKEVKSEAKEEEAAETIAKDPVEAAAPTETTAAATETSPPSTSQEDRPARDKRRTSLFGLGNIKSKKPTDTTETGEAAPAETKRERSPLPQRIGSIFRRSSRAPKATEETAPATTEPASTTETTKPEITINGDAAPIEKVVGDEAHAPIHHAVTATPEVEATA